MRHRENVGDAVLGDRHRERCSDRDGRTGQRGPTEVRQLVLIEEVVDLAAEGICQNHGNANVGLVLRGTILDLTNGACCEAGVFGEFSDAESRFLAVLLDRVLGQLSLLSDVEGQPNVYISIKLIKSQCREQETVYNNRYATSSYLLTALSSQSEACG